MARASGWLWVSCGDYLCHHTRAVALVPWAIRWNVEDPVPLIRRRFWCIMCERRGCLVQNPGPEHETLLAAPFPAVQVRVGGIRRIPESCNDQGVRCAAYYESRRPIWSRYWPC